MINDTLHIGDIVVENKQSFVVEGTPYFSDEVRQSSQFLTLQNIQKREIILLFIKMYTQVKLDVDQRRPSQPKQI